MLMMKMTLSLLDELHTTKAMHLNEIRCQCQTWFDEVSSIYRIVHLHEVSL